MIDFLDKELILDKRGVISCEIGYASKVIPELPARPAITCCLEIPV